jgi:hypothetical protein
MPIWNEELQQWGYLYYEEVPHFTWLGINRSMPITQTDLDNWFSYHSPKNDQSTRYETIRNQAKGLAELFLASSQPSADQTAALRKLRETVMAMNLAIACNE